MQKTVKILDTQKVTHDVISFRIEKPENYSFEPGQATEVAINKSGWKEEKRPFTFTSLPEDDELEFTIKIYPDHQGVTNELQSVAKDDELLLHEVFGAITYKGHGIFIAGGAGITPFIAILRSLKKRGKLSGHTLLFANKTHSDIILEDEFRELLGDRFINVLSDEEKKGYAHGLITRDFIEEHSENEDHYFYVCGPPPMMEMVLQHLSEMGVDDKFIVKEDL